MVFLEEVQVAQIDEEKLDVVHLATLVVSQVTPLEVEEDEVVFCMGFVVPSVVNVVLH